MSETDDLLLFLAQQIAQIKVVQKELASRTSEVQKQEGPRGLRGEKGEKGDKGPPGQDGQDGEDGKNGEDGKDGVSVVDAEFAADGSMVLKLSNGSEIDLGPMLGGSQESSMVIKKLNGGGPQVYVQSTAPENPSPGDIWYDTSA